MSYPPSDEIYAGEPGSPSPWTTRVPLEALRDTDKARIISLSPDVCLTPRGSAVVPVPYPIVDYCGHDAGYTPSVFFTGEKAMVLRSKTTHVHGDKPGTLKGIVSRTVENVTEPVGHAPQVRAEGSSLIRHLDRFRMNNGNTQGEAVFVRDTKTYPAPVDDDPVPGSLRWQERVELAYNGSAAEAFALAQPQPSQSPGGAPGQAPPNRPSVPPPRPQIGGPDNVRQGPWQPRTPPPRPQFDPRIVPSLLRYGRYGLMIPLLMLSGDTPLIPPLPIGSDPVEQNLNRRALDLLHPFEHSYNLKVREWYYQELESYHRHKRDQKPVAMPAPQAETESARVSERDRYRQKCEVNRYAIMRTICPQYGMQAHHIVPDWTLRYGSRLSSQRIPNMPSLNDGMAICVIGQARTGGTEHNRGHFADAAIERLGVNASPPFTARLDDVKDRSIAAMVAVRPDCAAEIIKQTNAQFAGRDPNQLLRAKQYPPLPQPTIDALKSGASAGARGAR